MRVTFQYQAMRYNNAMKASLNDLMLATDKAMKNRGLSDPEASPTRYIAAYNLQRIINDNTQFNANAENASGWLTAAESSITQAIEILSKVRDDLAIAGANGTNSADSMKALAGDVMGMYLQLLDLANTQYMGRYIFSGFQTTTQPFVSNSSSVSSVFQIYGQGGQVNTRDVFADFSELSSGQYTVQVDVRGDTGYLSLYDGRGNKVILDSNGSDESARGGNNTTTELAFKLVPGQIINTGRGVSIQIPENLSGGLKYQFTYTAGSAASYYGDSGQIANRIGANQNVITNFPGSELFLQTSKMLRSLQYNTVNGMALTPGTRFSQIDKANAGLGDSITIQGTDHNGYPVGAAKVLGTDSATLNMLNASEEARTLTIGYGGKYYQITVPPKGYGSIDELVETINHQLAQAQYAGSQSFSAHYADADAFAAAQNADIQAGLTVNAGADYQVDLSGRIRVVSDGGRLQFITSATGDQTSLSVTGGKHNTMGFEDKTVLAMGKDTVFEVGYDFAQDGINAIFTEHQNIDLNGPGAVTFIINGQPVILEGLDSATTKEAKELLIDRALQKAGFGSTVSARLSDAGTPGVYDVTFTMQNVNFDRNTHLSSMYYDSAGVSDFQTAALSKSITPYQKEKTVADYMNFLTDLYDGAVNVSLEDGRIVVEDVRSGESRLSMNVMENNEGISLPLVDQNVIVGGRYTGLSDDQWNVNVTMTHNANGTKSVDILIYDGAGKQIYTKTIGNYTGGTITLPSGVELAVDEMGTSPANPQSVTTFNLDLRAQTGLNFGDMNVVQEGTNSNMFESLMNLYNALNNGIGLNSDRGIGAPSSWDKNITSAASPYFDGVFSGNFNSLWKYEVEALNGKTDFYLQDMFTHTTGTVSYINDPAVTTLDFSVQVYDNATGGHITRDISVPLAGVTDSASLQKAIVEAVNTDPVLFSMNVHASAEGGAVSIDSGSGTRNITVIPKDEKDIYMMGVQTQSKSALQTEFSPPSTMDFHYMLPGGAWGTVNITLGGTYATVGDVINDINAQLGGAGTASLMDGTLTFTASGPFYYDNVVSPGGALGLSNTTQNYISGRSAVPLDVSGASDAERTLTFRYNDGSDKTASITIDALAYDSYEDLMAHINDKLAATGLAGAFTAVGYSTGVAFEPAAGVTFSSVEGDPSGYLGFPATGDAVRIKVTDEYGATIQYITADTAHKEYSVADGVLLGFDRGTLKAADSFTGTVGSGVDFEMGVLDMVQSQLTQALTQVGNRQLRVDTVMNFHKSLTSSYENQKAIYLKSTQADQLELTTNFSLATKAYEYALSVNARIISISIFDYL